MLSYKLIESTIQIRRTCLYVQYLRKLGTKVGFLQFRPVLPTFSEVQLITAQTFAFRFLEIAQWHRSQRPHSVKIKALG